MPTNLSFLCGFPDLDDWEFSQACCFQYTISAQTGFLQMCIDHLGNKGYKYKDIMSYEQSDLIYVS